MLMKVSDVMTKNFLAVGPETPIYKVQSLLIRYHLNDVLVTDAENKLLGIVTFSDICCKLLPDYNEFMKDSSYLLNPELIEDRLADIMHLPVKQAMTTNVITTEPDSFAIKAGALMTAKKIKQLPVVENNRLVGVISRTDITWGLLLKYCKQVPD